MFIEPSAPTAVAPSAINAKLILPDALDVLSIVTSHPGSYDTGSHSSSRRSSDIPSGFDYETHRLRTPTETLLRHKHRTASSPVIKKRDILDASAPSTLEQLNDFSRTTPLHLKRELIVHPPPLAIENGIAAQDDPLHLSVKHMQQTAKAVESSQSQPQNHHHLYRMNKGTPRGEWNHLEVEILCTAHSSCSDSSDGSSSSWSDSLEMYRYLSPPGVQRPEPGFQAYAAAELNGKQQ